MKKIISFILTMAVMCTLFVPINVSAASNSDVKLAMISTLYKSSSGRLTCDFDGYKTTKGRHEGIDFSYGYGKSVYSLTDGKVINISSGHNGSGGLSTISIYNSKYDVSVIYLHSNPNSKLSVGATVNQGDLIATEAYRGISKKESSHTHVEVREGKRTNAAKSVNDYTLDNKNPYTLLWNKYFTGKPSTPIIKACDAKSTNSVEVKWDKVSGADKYKIVRTEVDGKNPTTLTGSCTGTSYTDAKGLKPATTYYYKVYAINSKGTSDASKTFKTYTKPEAPVIQSAETNSETQLTIKWNKVSGVQSYTILYRKADGKDNDYHTLKANITETSYVHKGLSAGSKYCYRVVANRTGNLGTQGDLKQKTVSSNQSATKNGFTYLSGASNTLNDQGNVVLSWNKATSDAKKHTYHIYRKAPNGSYTDIGNTTSTTFTDKTAVSGTIYKYYIKTTNTSSENKDSTGAKSREFYAGPKFTKEITLTPQSATSMKISWNNVTSETGVQYVIKRKLPSDTEYTDIKTVTGTSYIDSGLKTGATYQYYVQIRDKSNHYLTSTYSKSVVMQILPTAISLNKASANVQVGETFSLSAAVSPSNSTNKTVTWASSNTNIATVSSNGVVTAKAEGTANITAKTSNGKTAICAVTVKPVACTNHNYGEWITDTEATCTESGSKHRTCRNDNCIETEIAEIPAKGHSYGELTVTKEATCTEDGEKARICTVCGDKTDAEAIPAKGHSFPEEWTTRTAVSCSSAGLEYRVCAGCGMEETREIEPLVHSYELIEETETTPEGPGHRTFQCKVCTETYTEEYVPEINQGILEIGSEAPQAGGEVKLPVTITENPGIAGFRVKVSFDKTALVPKYITAGEALTAGSLTSNLDQPGIDLEALDEVWIVWDNDADITEDGVLFYVTFDVKADAEGSYDVSLDYEKGEITTAREDVAYFDVMPSIINNKVTIADILKGDVNLDRRINTLDSVILSQYLAHWIMSFNEKQEFAADVFQDNRITSKDGVKLAQILSGFEPSTEKLSRMAAYSANSVVDSTKFEMEDTGALAGDYVCVPITVTDNPGMAGFNFELDYDKNKLTPVAMTKGDIVTSGDFISNLTEDNGEELDCVSAYWNDSSDMAEDGTLLTVMFLVNDDVQVGEELIVTLNTAKSDVCNQNLDDVTINSTGATITIVELTDEELEPDEGVTDATYFINDVMMKSEDGTIYDEIPANGDFDLDIDFTCSSEEFVPTTILVAAYEEKGCMMEVKSIEITEDMIADGICNTHIDETTKTIGTLKVFAWDSLNAMHPQSEAFMISNQK